MPTFVKPHVRRSARGKRSAVRGFVRTSDPGIRAVRKANAKGFRSARVERLREDVGAKLYRSINRDFKTSFSGRESGRTRLLKRMMHVINHTKGTSTY